MNSTFLFGFVFLIFGTQLVLADEKRELPEKFLGAWKVAESKNFDEYLTAKGFNWFTRQIVLHTSVTKTFQKSQGDPGTYDAIVASPIKTVKWLSWTLGAPFTALYVDDKQHRITFDYEKPTDTFTEVHQDLTKSDDTTDFIKYNVINGRLEMTVQCNGVQAVRFYDKQ